MNHNSKMAWYYTTATRAAEIMRAGFVTAADSHLPAGDRAIVAFSLRQHWDPIANEEVHAADGSGSRLSFEETVARGQGAWRFGMPTSQLLSWRALQPSAGISREDARALERAGRKVGSDPALWLASLEKIQVDQCVIEHLHGDDWCGGDHEHG